MQAAWIDHLSGLLKPLELEKNGRSIRELRRSFEAGKKQARLLPQIEAIYLASKELEEFKSDPRLYQSWFNQQKFKLTLGLKEVVLHSSGDPVQFQANIHRLFSHWDPELYLAPPEQQMANGLGVSNKQLRAAMKRMDRLSDNQIANMMSKVPQSEQIAQVNEVDLEQLIPSQVGRERATAIADRVKNAIRK